MDQNTRWCEQVLGGLWGNVVGDALGVPVEFLDCEQVRKNPVVNMRGFGTHNQPPGSWSDDSSLTLCTVDSLLNGFSPSDMAARFVQWFYKGLWTASGEPFDIGVATSDALMRVANGTPAEEAGSRDQFSNGNGSLMRMLPVAVMFADRRTEEMLDAVHRSSSITHRHPRSLMACGFFSLYVRGLLHARNPIDALNESADEFRRSYSAAAYAGELSHFASLLNPGLARRSEAEIKSSGYAINTLEASIWCLLMGDSFSDCVLKAVNLGQDTDTTGCVTGGLAGLYYGQRAIPKDWLNAIARKDDLRNLFERFLKILPPR